MFTEQMKGYIKEINPKAKPGDDDWDAPAFLFSFLELKDCHPSKISKYFGIDRKKVDAYMSRAKAQGILVPKWKKGKHIVHCNWFDEKEGGTAFILDVLTVQGMVERCEKKD